MQALSVAPRHLSQRERRVKLCEIKAFLSEEGGTAQAVTEGAARGQVCIRAILIYAARAVRTCFLALPLGELAFAQQMTERAAHWQIRVRANLQNPC